MELLKDVALRLREEGISGAHDIVYLTRYAALADDRRIAGALDRTLSGMTGLQADAFLAYAYGEYYEFSGKEYCPPAAEYILSSLDGNLRGAELGMQLMAYSRCSAAFGSLEYLEKAVELSEEAARGGGASPSLRDLAFTALGFAELYRTTLADRYLDAAGIIANAVAENFTSLFSPDDAYDIGRPSGNSAAAVLYETLYGFTCDAKWKTARDRQCAMISKLAERYPTAAVYGLCALLPDEFGRRSVVCRVSGDECPDSLKSILSYYAPTTYVSLEHCPAGEETKYYLVEDGDRKEIAF